MTECATFLQTRAQFSFQRQRPIVKCPRCLVVTEMLVAITDEAQRDRRAQAVTCLSIPFQNILEKRQRRPRAFGLVNVICTVTRGVAAPAVKLLTTPVAVAVPPSVSV